MNCQKSDPVKSARWIWYLVHGQSLWRNEIEKYLQSMQYVPTFHPWLPCHGEQYHSLLCRYPSYFSNWWPTDKWSNRIYLLWIGMHRPFFKSGFCGIPMLCWPLQRRDVKIQLAEHLEGSYRSLDWGECGAAKDISKSTRKVKCQILMMARWRSTSL